MGKRGPYTPIMVEVPGESGAPNWIPAAIGLLGSIAAVVFAVAVWQMSAAVSVAVMAVGVGVGLRQTLVGLAYWRAAELAGRARVIEAGGNAKAVLIDAQSRRPMAAGQIRRLEGGE